MNPKKVISPSYQRTKKMPRRLSRRELLTRFAAAGTGIAACGLLGTGTLLVMGMARQRPKPDIPPVPTATPVPTLTPVPPPYIARAAWGALEPDHEAENEHGFYGPDNPEGWRVYDTPLESTFQTLVIHHSVVYRGSDIATMHEIQRSHRQTRGWADVGYHFMVGKSGDIFEGRDIRVRGTHVEGYNTGSLGVCLLGNFTWETITDAQLNGLQVLMNWLVPYLNIPCLAAHRDFNGQTECPGDNLMNVVTALALAFGMTQGTGCYQPPADATPVAKACGCGCYSTT